MESLTLEIKKVGEDGDGIAIKDGRTIYVNNAMPGDLVRARITDSRQSYSHACLEEVIKKSGYRTKAKCPHVLQCGGCQIQEMKYDIQLRLKRSLVISSLKNSGLDPALAGPAIGCNMTFGFRNKAAYPLARGQEGQIITGFYARRSHSIIESMRCPVGAPENEEILKIVIGHLVKYGIEPYSEAAHQGVARHVLIRKAMSTSQMMVCIVASQDSIPHSSELVDRLLGAGLGIKSISINVNSEQTNSIKGRELINLYGSGYITDSIDGIKFKISPLSFYQVNSMQTRLLYSKAVEMCGLSGSETVFDIYCGVGTISLFLARKAAMVYGVESEPRAVDDAIENARINGISNARFIAGKAEEVIPDLALNKKITASVVVADPPRKGCDRPVLDTIIKMKPRKVVYVSCNPKSMARDLKYLSCNGFKICGIQPVDMFPHTVHVECVAELSLCGDSQ